MNKALIYTENYSRGGGNQYVIDLINYFPENYSIVFISNANGIFKEDLDKIKKGIIYEQVNIKSIPLLYNKIKLISNNKKIIFVWKTFIFAIGPLLIIPFKKKNSKLLSNKVESHRPDIVISCNGGYPGATTSFDMVYSAAAKNIPAWMTVVSMPKKKSLMELFYRDVHEKVNYLIVNAQNIRNGFLETRKFDNKQVQVLYNSVPDKFIKYQEIAFDKYSKDLPTYKLGYIGRIEKNKGVFYLLEAFSELSSEFPNLQLTLVGTGPDMEEAKTYCIEKNMSQKVHFTGYYPGEIQDMLKTFQLFVFPSLWEGLPYSILEAMANGKLVISTNVGGIPEIITNGYNGFLVNPGKAPELVTMIKHVLLSSNNDQIVLNAVKTINDKFSENIFGATLRSLVNSTSQKFQE